MTIRTAKTFVETASLAAEAAFQNRSQPQMEAAWVQLLAVHHMLYNYGHEPLAWEAYEMAKDLRLCW